MTAVLDGTALGRWVEIALPEPPWSSPVPFVGFAYLDPQAGMSAKGGPADEPGSTVLVVRLPIGAPSRILSEAEVAARGLPTSPTWVAAYGPQPPRAAPWRTAPALRGRWHRQFPDDTAVLCHDGDPARTGVAPEGCWVRVVEQHPAPARPAARADGAAVPLDGAVYVGELLTTPRHLRSLAPGDRVWFLADAARRHALQVSPAYLAERPAWTVTPCPRCGLVELFEPPSVAAAARFPEQGEVVAFTVRCPLCPPPAALALARCSLEPVLP